MHRAVGWVALAGLLAGCPSTAEYREAPALHDAANDATDAVRGGDVQIEFVFSGAALEGSDGGVTVQANLTWHGTVSGRDGSVSFEGEFR